jgi:Domain of unknown function (DUF5069)
MDTNKVKKLAKDLAKDFPRSPRETLAGYVIAARTLDKCRAALAGTPGEYHFDCPLDNFFFSFTEISEDEFKNCVASGASDEEVAKWIEHKAKQRPRVQIIKWNNDWRYKRLSEMPDPIQEFMEEYIPQFVPLELRYHIDYFFDIYDAEEKRIRP